jgi:hypothetical protein
MTADFLVRSVVSSVWRRLAKHTNIPSAVTLETYA